MSPITTHVLDTSRGKPAAGVSVVLAIEDPSRPPTDAPDGRAWCELGKSVTNEDGRARDLLPPGASLAKGIYRITFDTGAYFVKTGATGFYPWVTVVFEVREDEAHHHVPLLLSPYGYSTYRGS